MRKGNEDMHVCSIEEEWGLFPVEQACGALSSLGHVEGGVLAGDFGAEKVLLSKVDDCLGNGVALGQMRLVQHLHRHRATIHSIAKREGSVC